VLAVNYYTAASYPKCCRSSRHWSQKIRAYDTCSTGSSLATSSTTDYVQVGSSDVQVSTWHGPAVTSTYCDLASTFSSRQLRAVHTVQVTVPRTKTNYGYRNFTVQGPSVWNSLTAELCTPDISLDMFRNNLKTLLFDA